MIGYIHIAEVIACLIYALILIGVGRLARKYPETIAGINTMPKERREKLNLPKIGAFVAKWLNASAVVVLLGMWIPKSDLRWQVVVWIPCFLIMLAAGYLIKYKHTRFSKETDNNE